MKNLDADDIIGEVVSDEMAVTGTFESCDTILNKVYKNAYWGILGNYKGMPVDCPQRDERQPWLGDRTRGCFGEAFIFDNNNLYAKWARDIVESQREDGCIPDVAPAFWNYYSDIITWPPHCLSRLEMMYNQFGDDKPLRLYYPAVKKWLAHMKYQYGKDGLMPRDKFADWCLPPTDEKTIHCRDPKRTTDGTLIATAYYYQLNKLMERFATILSKDTEAGEYAAEAAIVKDAFNKKFLTVNRAQAKFRTRCCIQTARSTATTPTTANLLPLVFGMIDDDYVRSEAEKNIIHNIITVNKGMMPCGIIGGQWLMHGLTDMGRADIAWLLATNKKYPSWGYMTEKGATTIWELWNGDTANPKMNSANHVMQLGDLIAWLYEDVAGISSDLKRPGFKHIIMKPDFSVDEMGRHKGFLQVNLWQHRKPLAQGRRQAVLACGNSPPTRLPKFICQTALSRTSVLAHTTLRRRFPYKTRPSSLTTSYTHKHLSHKPIPATIAETTKGDLVATYFGEQGNAIPMCAFGLAANQKAATSGLNRSSWPTAFSRQEATRRNSPDCQASTARTQRRPKAPSLTRKYATTLTAGSARHAGTRLSTKSPAATL